MRLEHFTYVSLVTEEYKSKKAANQLSPLLSRSTPANIRQECLNVYQERYNKKDDGLLRAFFGPAEPGKNYLNIIRDFETDKFRPLDNYLKGATDKTEDKNLDLLAWLIDFQPRPYTFDMEAPSNIPGIDEAGQVVSPIRVSPIPESGKGGTANKPEKMPTPQEGQQPVNPPRLTEEADQKAVKMKTAIATLWIAVISLAGAYIFWQGVMPRPDFEKTNTGCMYWTGTHYEGMPCNEASKSRLKLPMDQEKMRSFKRIMREDTITRKSIGNVYYIKMDGRIEYYTRGGHHPVDVTRNLRQLTDYMYTKYLDKQKVPKKDSLFSQL